MSCTNERFRNVEGEGFPPVTEYDYVTNPYFRGPSDATFRWREVSIEGNYLFSEITLSGSLEHNSIDFSSSGVVKLTGAVTVSTDFSGWTTSGDAFWAIGASGGVFEPYSRAIAPLSESNSLVIWATGTDARLENTTAYTSSVGISNPHIQSSKRHQVFFNTYAISGSGEISSYIEGINGGSVVAYYNPHTEVWEASKPTGYFSLEPDKYTYVRYDFIPQNFPATTPTTYKLVIEQETGNANAPIVVDEIHIDRYLKKNAFTDFLIPTGYFIEITPDLGWHNTLALFEGTEQNPFIRKFGPFVENEGTLVDNLDGTVQVTLPVEEFKSVLSNSYTKYLWRALPISPNNIITEGGHPVRFKYLGEITASEFSIDTFVDDKTNPVKIITGTRNKRLTVLVDDQVHPNIEYPTDTSWKLTINLDVAEKVIKISAVDLGGATSSPYYIDLELDHYHQSLQAVWNTFDEYGLLMDIDRLPYEANSSYKDRIKDTFLGGGNSTFGGVVSASSRELNLTRYNDALIITPSRNKYNLKQNSAYQLEITAYSVRIRNQEMVRTESKRVDNVYESVQLDKLPNGTPLSIVFESKNVNLDNVSFPESHENYNTDQYTMYISDRRIAGKIVEIKYEYFEELLFSDYPTLGQLLTALNNLTFANNKLVSVSLNYLLSGAESCRGLYKIFTEFDQSSDPINISWSPVVLNRISDPTFRTYSTSTNLRKSKFYEYIKELKNNSRILWGYVQSDRDFWDAFSSSQEGIDSYPIYTDPDLSQYYTNFSADPIIGRVVYNTLSRDKVISSQWTSNTTSTGTITESSDKFLVTFKTNSSTARAYKSLSYSFKANTYYCISVNLVSFNKEITDTILGVDATPNDGDKVVQASYITKPGRYCIVLKYTEATTTDILFGLGIQNAEEANTSVQIKEWMVEELASVDQAPSEYAPPNVGSVFDYNNNSTITNNYINFAKGSSLTIDKTKTALLIGDSFSNEQPEIPYKLKDYDSDWVIYSDAFNGRALSQAVNIVENVYNLTSVTQSISGGTYDIKFNKDTLKARYFIAILGVNDILLANNDLSQLQQSALAFIDKSVEIRKDAIVVLSTIPPFGNTILYSEERESIRQNYNLWLKAYAISKSNVEVYDLATLFEDSNDTKDLNPAYDSGDGLHPNTTGSAVAAEFLATTLNNIFNNIQYANKNKISKLFDAVDAWSRNFSGYSNDIMKNLGLDYKFFQPGVAHTNDLAPEIYTTFSLTNSLEDNSTAVANKQNNNRDPIFSGQR